LPLGLTSLDSRLRLSNDQGRESKLQRRVPELSRFLIVRAAGIIIATAVLIAAWLSKQPWLIMVSVLVVILAQAFSRES
jgi:magnesium-transporting ATPase (P-type)